MDIGYNYCHFVIQGVYNESRLFFNYSGHILGWEGSEDPVDERGRYTAPSVRDHQQYGGQTAGVLLSPLQQRLRLHI